MEARSVDKQTGEVVVMVTHESFKLENNNSDIAGSQPSKDCTYKRCKIKS